MVIYGNYCICTLVRALANWQNKASLDYCGLSKIEVNFSTSEFTGIVTGNSPGVVPPVSLESFHTLQELLFSGQLEGERGTQRKTNSPLFGAIT